MKFISKLNKYISKNDIITMTIIVMISVVIAVIFNILRSDKCSGKIPFFKTSIEKRIVSDDDLFGNLLADAPPINIPDNTEAVETIIDTIASEDTIKVDTATTIAETKIDALDYEALLKESKKGTDDYSVITLKQMQRIAEDTSGNFIIVDARRPEDFKGPRIGNAINIFPYMDDASLVIDKVMALNKSKTIIVYCDGGDCDSSHRVGDILKMLGYRFFIFEGGWEEWTK